ASYSPGLAACWPNWQAIEAVPIAAAGSSTSMNTNRSPSIGPDPGVNRSGRALLSVGVCLLHDQFPNPRSAAMNAIIDATLRARAPRDALSVASTRSIGGFPGRFSTSGSEVWDEENISISFQLLHGPAVDQRGQIGENRVVGEVVERQRTVQGDAQPQRRRRRAGQSKELIPPANLVLRDAEHLSLCGRQPLLVLRIRPVAVLFGNIEFSGAYASDDPPSANAAFPAM